MKRKELRDDEMPALARIISDAILADRIIDEEEIANYKELLGDAPDSKLVYKDKSSGKEVSFKDKSLAFAVETLKSTEAKECLDRVLDRIIHSDGVCSSSEAKFQIALDYYFNHNEIHTLCGKICHKYEIKSFKLYDMLLGQNFVFYTENHKDKELNDEISRNYSIISNLLASIGFQFVYIPELAKLYSDKGKLNLRRKLPPR